MISGFSGRFQMVQFLEVESAQWELNGLCIAVGFVLSPTFFFWHDLSKIIQSADLHSCSVKIKWCSGQVLRIPSLFGLRYLERESKHCWGFGFIDFLHYENEKTTKWKGTFEGEGNLLEVKCTCVVNVVLNNTQATIQNSPFLLTKVAFI